MTDTANPMQGWYVRFHRNNYMASVSFDNVLGMFVASAHKLNAVDPHWSFKDSDLQRAMKLADADVPSHDCRECPPWERRETPGELPE